MRRLSSRRTPVIVSSQESAEENDSLVEESPKHAKIANERPWDLDFGRPSSPCSTPKPRASRTSAPVLPSTSFDAVYSDQVIPWESLVIHKKKLAELERWFSHFSERQAKRTGGVLLLSGPSGSGKTCAARSLCRQYGIEAVDGYDFDDAGPRRGQGACIARKSSAFPSLRLVGDDEAPLPPSSRPAETMSGPRVIIFDNLPNVESHDVLKDLLLAGCGIPLQMVLIATDPCGHRSLCDDPILRRIRGMAMATHISFNPMAPSLIKKLLQGYNGKAQEGDLYQGGDARAALLQAGLASLTKDRTSTGSSCDASFDIFHLAGKILYPRQGKQGIDPGALTEGNRALIHTLLAHNYPKFLTSVDALALIADSFSWLEAVNWTVRKDHLWESCFSSLPETIISALTQRDPHRSFTFQPIEAPRYGASSVQLSVIEEEPE